MREGGREGDRDATISIAEKCSTRALFRRKENNKTVNPTIEESAEVTFFCSKGNLLIRAKFRANFARWISWILDMIVENLGAISCNYKYSCEHSCMDLKIRLLSSR